MRVKAKFIGEKGFMLQVRLLLANVDKSEILMQDGTWQPYDEAAVLPDGAGIALPDGAVKEILDAAREWEGVPPPPKPDPTALEREAGRVDRLLEIVADAVRLTR